jgi:hypothetical protein
LRTTALSVVFALAGVLACNPVTAAARLDGHERAGDE